MRNLKQKDINVLVNLITRYYKFHKNEELEDIKLWGLLSWREISLSVKKGLINTDYNKENYTCWFTPTTETINSYIRPFINTIYINETHQNFDYECEIIMAELVKKVDSIETLREYISTDKDFLETCEKYKDTIMFNEFFNYALIETISEVNTNVSSYCLDKEYKDYAWLKTKKYIFNLDEIYSFFKLMVKELEEELLTEK